MLQCSALETLTLQSVLDNKDYWNLGFVEETSDEAKDEASKAVVLPITTLELFDCNFSAAALSRTLSACPNLEILTYEQRRDTSEDPAFQVDVFRDSLEQHESTLKELNVWSSAGLTWIDKEFPLEVVVYERLERLDAFVNLKRLEIEAHLLFGPMRGDTTYDSPLCAGPRKRNFLCCREADCSQFSLDENDDEVERGKHQCIPTSPLPKSLQHLSIKNSSVMITSDLLALLSRKEEFIPELNSLEIEWPRHVMRYWWKPYWAGAWPNTLAIHKGDEERLRTRCKALGIEFKELRAQMDANEVWCFCSWCQHQLDFNAIDVDERVPEREDEERREGGERDSSEVDSEEFRSFDMFGDEYDGNEVDEDVDGIDGEEDDHEEEDGEEEDDEEGGGW